MNKEPFSPRNSSAQKNASPSFSQKNPNLTQKPYSPAQKASVANPAQSTSAINPPQKAPIANPAQNASSKPPQKPTAPNFSQKPFTPTSASISTALYMSIMASLVTVMPGRFVCGIVLAVEELLLFALCALFSSLLQKLKLASVKESALCVFIVAFVIFYKQLVALFMGTLALQLSFIFFLPAVSSFSTVFIISDKTQTLASRFKTTATPHITFCAYIAAISLFRDIVGFGTLTLPTASGVLELKIFDSEQLSFGSFLATIPGAFILSALVLCAFVFIKSKKSGKR